MRIVLNTIDVCSHKTGVGHYTAELLGALRRQGEADRVECFPGPVLRRAHAAWRWCSRGREGPPGPATVAAPGRPGLLRRATRSLRRPGAALRRGFFRAVCRTRGYDLYHEPNHVPLEGCELPTVVTVHDLSVLLHPQWHPAERVAYYERNFHRGLARCDHVLAVSEFTRREVIGHLGVPPARVTRTYNGIRPGLRPLPESEVRAGLGRLGLPERYLLYLGTIEPRKNVRTLLKAYCALPAAVRDRFPLLLVGGWGWGVAEEAEYLDREGRHKGVRHLGYVPEAALGLLYNGARALTYPSLYEGFGLPPVEMLACGGAVLASTAGAVAETAGAAAHLIDPHDEAGWRDALLRVCTDDGWWQQLRSGATEVAAGYRWDRCAAQTLDVYRTVLSGGRATELAAA
jgi:alpha-1,3-rhamnosyl/mannosyltransferase